MDAIEFALLFPHFETGKLQGRAPWKDEGIGGRLPRLVVTPEFYACAPESAVDVEDWRRFCSERGSSAVVGEAVIDPDDWQWNIAHVFTPKGAYERVYTKHSTAHSTAWEASCYAPSDELATFHVPGIGRIAPIICHDGYLGGIIAKYAEQSPRLLVNLTGGGVKPEKWLSVHRLRALEHRVPVLCSMAHFPDKPSSGPFAFDADGQAVRLVRADGRPVSSSRPGAFPGTQFGTVRLGTERTRAEALQALPPAEKSLVENGNRPGTIHVRLLDGVLSVAERRSSPIDTPQGPKWFEAPLVVRLEEEEIFDYWRIFQALQDAKGQRVIFHSAWRRLPAPPDRMAHVLLGRCLENLSPFVLSDASTIYEVVEVAGAAKVMRRSSCASSQAWVDLRFALGLRNALKMLEVRDSIELAKRCYAAWSRHPRHADSPIHAPGHQESSVAAAALAERRATGTQDQDLRDEVWRWALARRSSGLPPLLRDETPPEFLRAEQLDSAWLAHARHYVDMYGMLRPAGEPHWTEAGPRCCGVPMQREGPRRSSHFTCSQCCAQVDSDGPPMDKSDYVASLGALVERLRPLVPAGPSPDPSTIVGAIACVDAAMDAIVDQGLEMEFDEEEVLTLEILGHDFSEEGEADEEE